MVDDDAGDQELTRRALQDGLPGADIRSVHDGVEALDYLLHRETYADPGTAPAPDLMLLDLNMPRMCGREMLERLNQDPSLRRIPVIVLTTSQQEADILRSYELGCNSFITKPVSIDEFMESMRQLGMYWFGLVSLPTT